MRFAVLGYQTANLDVLAALATARRRLEAGSRRQSDFFHRMRYFFAPELVLFLESSGFRALRLGAFPDFDREPDETTWNVLATATAAGP